MREKMLTDRTSRIPLLVVLLVSLVPFSSSDLGSAETAVTTSITQTTGTGNFGTQVVLPPPGENVYGIQGGQTVGANLFHSFGQFNVGPGDIAQFQTSNLSPTLAISNILGRVTGQQSPSQIFGTIDSVTYYPAANLFLMNPYGFLFGPNATVNVGGMMTFTTADYLGLVDGGRFNANPNTALGDNLISADVVAFGFLSTNLHPAEIRFEGGQLTVGSGTGLALVGGDINLIPDASGTPSGITAHGRSIKMTSVAAGPGEVAADTWAPAAGMALGTITLGQGTTLDTSGDISVGDDSGNGGAISIRGGQLVAMWATINTIPANGSFGSGGSVTVDVTGTANLTDSQILTGPGTIFSISGSGGAVSITANESLAMTNTTIDTDTFLASGDPGHVNAGPVTLKTNGPLSLTDSAIFTFASAPGNGGAVNIAGMDVTFTRSRVDTFVDTGFFDLTVDDPALGLVHPGAVTVTAENLVTFSGSYPGNPVFPIINTQAIGTLMDAGPVTITGKTVNLSNGTINTSITEGQIPSPGNGGTIQILGNNVNLSQFSLTSTNAGFTASTGKGGNILLRGDDHLLADNIQMTNSAVDTNSVSGGAAGNIDFQTNTLTLNNTQVRANTFSIGSGGSIAVHGAQTVALQSTSLMDTSAIVSGTGNQGPFGPAGSILLETQQLTMQGGSALRAADLPFSKGDAGSITVRGTDGHAQSILIDGAGTGMFTDAEGNGAGGDINLFASSVTLQNSGTLSATTSGTIPSAIGGTITVNANTVTLTTGGTMTAKSIGAGAAGDITVQGLASPGQSVLIDGSGSGISSNTEGTGAGGNIFVNANSVTLQNGGKLSATTSGTSAAATGGTIMVDADTVQLNNGGIITASTTGAGVGGSITISAGNTFTSNASTVSSTATQAQGGDIKITAGQSATLNNGSSISASSIGAGDAGDIVIDAGQIFLATNSSVTTQANQASGGAIKITTNSSGTVELTNSLISASVLNGTGGGGSVNIDPLYVLMQNSQILARAFEGPGGNITINITNGGLFLPDANSTISASSQFGVNGTVTIQNPNAPAGGHIQPLEQSPLLATSLLNQRCAALAGGEFSSFTVEGRGSLPTEPSSWLASPLALDLTGTGGGTLPQKGGRAAFNDDSASETTILSLRQIAPAGFLTQTFAVDQSTSCQS